MLSLEDTEDVTLDDEVKMYAEEFKKGKMLYIAAKLSPDKKSIIADEERCRGGEPGADNAHYAEFCSSLPTGQCSLSAVHYNLNGQPKVVFVTWCPEGVEMRDALILNVTKYHFRQAVKPDLNVKASEQADIEESEISEQLETGRPPTAISGIFQSEDFSNCD